MPQLFSRYMDTNFDGSGTKEAITDYSSAEEEFGVKPTTGDLRIDRLIVSIEDTSGFQAEEYGNLGAALTNGIRVLHMVGDQIRHDYTNGSPIKTNGQWGQVCYDVSLKSWGAGDEILLVRWTFERGHPVRLRASRNDRLVVRVNDNFTGLISHKFLAQGEI